jgi:hypothetical protein
MFDLHRVAVRVRWARGSGGAAAPNPRLLTGVASRRGAAASADRDCGWLLSSPSSRRYAWCMGKRVLLSHRKYLAFDEATAKGLPRSGAKREVCERMLSDVIGSLEREYDSVPSRSRGTRDDCWLLVILPGAIRGEGLVVGMGCNHRNSLAAMIDVCTRRGMPRGAKVLRELQQRITTPRLSRERLVDYHKDPHLVKLLGGLQRKAERIEICAKPWFEPLMRLVMSDPAAFFETQPKKSKHRNKKK